MISLPLVAAVKHAESAFPERYEKLRASILETYQKHGARALDRLDLECALFIFWSVGIGILNSKSWWLDNWLSERRFARALEHCWDGSRGKEIAAGPTMCGLYRTRFRDVLRTIRNVYIRWDDAGRIEVPLTPRSTGLFLAYTVEAPNEISQSLRQNMHGLLTEICREYVLATLPDRVATRV